MRIPPASYLHILQAYRRGDHLVVLAGGDAAAAALVDDPATSDLAFEVWAMIGAVHAAQERFAMACTYLEHAVGPAPAPGSAPRHGGAHDWSELLLLDLYLRLGRYDDALVRIAPLVDPERHIQTRFTATRAQAAIAGARADFETAHFLLNTAVGLALRIRSRFRGALVEGDRALLLAAQGRFYEAIGAADAVLASFVRPAIGDYQRWGNLEGAVVALTIARLAAAADDQLTAQRMLIQGTTAVERDGSTYLRGHLELTRGAFWTAEGNVNEAEAALFEAQRTFNVLGCPPASALATLEQGRLAGRRGLSLSARPLLERAMAEFRVLGQPREVNEARRLLAALPAEPAAAGWASGHT